MRPATKRCFLACEETSKSRAEAIGEVNGENERLNNNTAPHNGVRLVEVTNSGTTSQMSREEVDQLKERQDIRVHDTGDKATILNKIRG